MLLRWEGGGCSPNQEIVLPDLLHDFGNGFPVVTNPGLCPPSMLPMSYAGSLQKKKRIVVFFKAIGINKKLDYALYP